MDASLSLKNLESAGSQEGNEPLSKTGWLWASLAQNKKSATMSAGAEEYPGL
jgi:hypothetical protein